MNATEPRTIERLPVNAEFAPPGRRRGNRAGRRRPPRQTTSTFTSSRMARRRGLVLSLIPEGAEVGQGASLTLEQIGVTAAIEKSGCYEAIRPRVRAMDRATQIREIRKLGGCAGLPDQQCPGRDRGRRIVVASFGGSQLGPIVSGAGRVILVAGAQKLSPIWRRPSGGSRNTASRRRTCACRKSTAGAVPRRRCSSSTAKWLPDEPRSSWSAGRSATDRSSAESGRGTRSPGDEAASPGAAG